MTELITYETISKVWRGEKGEQLAKLPDGFWPAARAWLAAKQKEGNYLEAENARKLVEDIVNRRLRKVVVAALASARGAAPPSGLTSEEAKLFDQLVATIRVAGRSALESALGVDSVVMEKIAEARKSMEEARIQPALKSPRKVKLLAALPAVVGADNQTYGPFEAGAVVELPQDIADVLAARGAAETVI